MLFIFYFFYFFFEEVTTLNLAAHTPTPAAIHHGVTGKAVGGGPPGKWAHFRLPLHTYAWLTLVFWACELLMSAHGAPPLTSLSRSVSTRESNHVCSCSLWMCVRAERGELIPDDAYDNVPTQRGTALQPHGR